MKLVSADPAGVRARRATVVAAAAGAAAVVGMWMVQAAPRRGVILTFVALVVLSAALRRRQDLMLLASLATRPVAEIARPAPVLRRHGSIDGIDELRRMAGCEVGVVSTDAGWRVLSSADVADAVLAAPDGRFSGDWSRYLRVVPALPADLPACRLRRTPDGSEHWLVLGEGQVPMVLTVGCLVRAARTASVPSQTAAEAPRDQPALAPDVELLA